MATERIEEILHLQENLVAARSKYIIEAAEQASEKSAPLVEALVRSYFSIHKTNTTKSLEIKQLQYGVQGPVSEADISAQATGLEIMHQRFPEANFIVEEEKIPDSTRAAVLNSENYLNNIANGQIIVYDPIDGSAKMLTGKDGEWGMLAGLMENGTLTAGAIYNPGNQSIVFGSTEEVFSIDFTREPESVLKRIGNLPDYPLEIYYKGVDFSRMSGYDSVLGIMGQQSTALYTAGSSAVALQDIITGKAKLAVIPYQYPWDWAGAYPLLKAAGGQMVFYSINEGKIELYSEPRPEFYHPSKKQAGYIAGTNELVERYSEILRETYIDII